MQEIRFPTRNAINNLERQSYYLGAAPNQNACGKWTGEENDELTYSTRGASSERSSWRSAAGRAAALVGTSVSLESRVPEAGAANTECTSRASSASRYARTLCTKSGSSLHTRYVEYVYVFIVLSCKQYH